MSLRKPKPSYQQQLTQQLANTQVTAPQQQPTLHASSEPEATNPLFLYPFTMEEELGPVWLGAGGWAVLWAAFIGGLWYNLRALDISTGLYLTLLGMFCVLLPAAYVWFMKRTVAGRLRNYDGAPIQVSWGQVDVSRDSLRHILWRMWSSDNGGLPETRIELATRKHTFDWVYPTWNWLAAGILAILATGRALFEGIFGPLAFYSIGWLHGLFIVTMLLLLLIASDARPTPRTKRAWLAQRLETAKQGSRLARNRKQQLRKLALIMAATWLVTIGWQYSLSVLGLWVIWLCALVLLCTAWQVLKTYLPHVFRIYWLTDRALHITKQAPLLLWWMTTEDITVRYNTIVGCSTLDAGLADEGLGYGDVVISQLGANGSQDLILENMPNPQGWADILNQKAERSRLPRE